MHPAPDASWSLCATVMLNICHLSAQAFCQWLSAADVLTRAPFQCTFSEEFAQVVAWLMQLFRLFKLDNHNDAMENF